jgi:hypothetical protein
VFLVDDILLSPLKGLAVVCRKIEEAARQDLENQEKQSMVSLSELHRQLESGQIEVKDFDNQEARLLEHIELLQRILYPDQDFS